MGWIVSRGCGWKSWGSILACVWILGIPGTRASFAQGASKPAQQTAPNEQAPPEEDEGTAPKQYAFNPLQANKEITVGNFYAKKHNWKGAAQRYREATRWNPTLAEAFLKLGEAEEKLSEKKAAKEAYEKYIQLAPDGKAAPDVKKRLAKLSEPA